MLKIQISPGMRAISAGFVQECEHLLEVYNDDEVPGMFIRGGHNGGVMGFMFHFITAGRALTLSVVAQGSRYMDYITPRMNIQQVEHGFVQAAYTKFAKQSRAAEKLIQLIEPIVAYGIERGYRFESNKNYPHPTVLLTHDTAVIKNIMIQTSQAAKLSAPVTSIAKRFVR